MCYCITLTVGAGADFAGVRECGGRYGLACEAFLDSRLRGNDIGRGNDIRRGNDIGRGNDRGTRE